MNRPILCCLKVKQASLFVGIVDLILHMMVLTKLFALYSHPNLFDHYYANSLSLIVSPSSSFYSNSLKNINDIDAANSNSQLQLTSTLLAPTSLSRNSNQLYQWHLKSQIKLNRQFDSDSFGSQYSTVSMSRDKSIAFLVTTFSAFLTIMLIYGIIKNRPSYLMPYFSIKVFHVVMGCLTTLGFYSCLPNVRLWIETHHFFPMKKELLLLENQTLELFVFSILLTSILVKLYVVIIVWYCYRHMVSLKSFVNMSATSGLAANSLSANLGLHSFNGTSVGYKIDDETLINNPPKYEDIMKQIKREKSSNPIDTINLNNTNPTTSSSIVELSNDVIIPLREQREEISNEANFTTLQSPPSYIAAILGKKSTGSQIVI